MLNIIRSVNVTVGIIRLLPYTSNKKTLTKVNTVLTFSHIYFYNVYLLVTITVFPYELIANALS